MYSLRLLIESIHTLSTCFRFWDVFETINATSNNSFSKTTKWILMFLVQNEEEVLLVSFLFTTAHFCWVENDENFDSSKEVSFVQVFFTNVGVSAELECQQQMLENPGINAYCRIRPPQTFLYLPKPTPHQISRQTEHLAMCTSGARKSASGTRNEPTYSSLRFSGSAFIIRRQQRQLSDKVALPVTRIRCGHLDRPIVTFRLT